MVKDKIYCYVDETGQDTKGELFIVIAIVVGNTKDIIETVLINTERDCGKRKRKWIKTRKKEREIYLKQLLLISDLKNRVFYHMQKNTKAYESQTIPLLKPNVRFGNEIFEKTQGF